MVTLITEKLRSQTLDDVQFEPIPQLAKLATSDLTTPNWAAPTQPGSHVTDKRRELYLAPLTTESNHDRGEKSGRLPGTTTRQRHASLDTPRHHGEVHKSPAHPISATLICDSLSSTPPAPPLKRHCRSLSIPGDMIQVGVTTPKTWQPQASTIWKPVALRPHFRDSKLMKNRHSPHLTGLPQQKNRHSSGPGNLCTVTPRRTSPSGSLGAPDSADSGTGHHSSEPSYFGLWSVASSDSFSTPPESPIPRPASASSGYYDSSQGSLNAPWLDALNQTGVVGVGGGGGGVSSGIRNFKVRSFSMEEPISNAAVPGHSTPTAGSMPVIPGSVSTPSSPRRPRVPRCRSQPCDLHDRKCGIKRRREEDRPTLDLFKMKETAYDRTNRVCSGRQKNVQFAEKELRSGRILPSIFSEPPECFLGLNTIASSPLDNVLPALNANALSLTASGNTSTAESRTPSESARHPRSNQGGNSKLTECAHGEVFPELKVKPGTSRSIKASSINNHDRMGGGSASESESDGDAEVASSLAATDQEEQVFQFDMNSELDLDQIEKD